MLRSWLGFAAISSILVTLPVQAEQPLFVAYPPNNHETSADQIFLIGTAPPEGEVFVNNQRISRSAAGHFAPSFPLQLGQNLFTLRYHNQQVQIQVIRKSTAPPAPVGIAFAENSLSPAVDVAKLPGELICLSAIAPSQATVSVKLGNQTLSLLPQGSSLQLPDNSAVLTGVNQPLATSLQSASQFQGCTTTAQGGVNLGKPQFQLTANGTTLTQTAPGNISILSPTQFEIAEVIVDSGTARTGPGTDYSRLTPLPKGTQARIIGREGEWLKLDYGAWIRSKETRIFNRSTPPLSLIRSIRARQIPGWTEILFPLQLPVPVSVQQGSNTFTLNLYNTTTQTDVIHLDDDPLIQRLDWQQITPTQAQYVFNLKTAQQWGYKLRYEGTTLILSLRHPPQIPSGNASPLSGMTILLDPGHGSPNDLGARGPNGLPEKDVALQISKLVQAQLIQRGAKVIMTREGDDDLYPQDRVDIIEKQEPQLAISLHYNALPDQGDAINTKGIAAFWYYPQAHSLAVFLHNYLVESLNRPSNGVFWNNLALTRPSVAPSVLLELGFMINPEEFEWIINPAEQQRLANAIADGIVQWTKTR